MLDLLYTLFIAPLEFWMEKTLFWGFDHTQSWGWAIIVMSLVVNTVILPIYLKAEHWQEEERSIRKSFEKDEAMIKRTFKGQERFAMITTMHRQAGYSPLLTLRSSIGFFLQIPFFFAAYHFLSHFEPLQGISFLGLNDLSKPDELFKIGDFTINFMPILMTVINIVSALIYTQNLSKRDKYQLYGMAAIFLVLLYNAASGLVLYWTFNNFYSLGKNVVINFLNKFKTNSNQALQRDFPWSIVSLTTLLLLCLPELVWLSDLSAISENVNDLLTSLISYYLLGLLIAIAIGVLLRRVSHYVEPIFLTALCLALLYAFIFTGDYGTLQGKVLTSPEALYERGSNIIKDIGIICVVIFCMILLIKKSTDFISKISKISKACCFCSIVLGIALAVPIQLSNSSSPSIIKTSEHEDTKLNELKTIYWDKFLGFSSNHKNLVLIILDMFTGDHLPHILKDYPEIQDGLEGFVYYPDTLAAGSGTIFGVPAILGGKAYFYDEMEARGLKTTRNEIANAANVIPQLLEGWSSINATLEFYNEELAKQPTVHFPRKFWNDNFASNYFNNSFIKVSARGQQLHLMSIALFKAFPYSLRRKVYRKGEWLYPIEQLATHRDFSLLQALSENSFVKETLYSTYRMIHTGTTHSKNFSDKTFKPAFRKAVPSDPIWEITHPFIDYNHYISEVASLKELIKWLDLLKNKNIFDNTRIIIVSDHGDWDASRLMKSIGLQPFRDNYYGEKLVNPGMRSALLLFKDFNNSESFYTDEFSLLSNGDIVEILLKDICTVPIIHQTGFKEKSNPERIRKYQSGNVQKSTLQTLFEIEGTMYNKNNWKLKFSRDH